MKNKTPRYYPVKTKKGFRIVKTYKKAKDIHLASFTKKRTAKASGQRWYG